MAPSPDLFVVCKQCGSEVSPYITECPYCGARLRQRAPKLPRMKGSGRATRGLARLRLLGRTPSGAGARERGVPGSQGAVWRRRGVSGGVWRRRGYRSDAFAAGLPYATIALVAAGCAGWVAVRGGYASFFESAIVGPLNGDWWKLFSSPFVYVNGLYAFVALLSTAIFGWLLERRHGPVAVIAVFFGGAVSGALVAEAVYPLPIVSGANAAALALIAAWSVPDVLAARRSRYYEGELLGACAFAAVLLLTPYARPEASWLAGFVGACVGLVLGLGLTSIESPED
ncbi:MAG TPA: rhomboid family intramembrane serine protease [Solirubrobacteraceae bacterium]|nr:rhomboid family intramembrane serine protease [Solirubrobacteraceae bacterium]